MAGALPEAELLALLAEVGFTAIALTQRFACFAGTSAEQKVAADLGIAGANVTARMPG